MPQRKKFKFSDLDFQPISENSRTLKATLSFLNGYGCNVYMHSEGTNKWLPYEFELLYNGKPTVNTELSDGNIGYSSEDDINQYLSIAQRL